MDKSWSNGKLELILSPDEVEALEKDGEARDENPENNDFRPDTATVVRYYPHEQQRPIRRPSAILRDNETFIAINRSDLPQRVEADDITSQGQRSSHFGWSGSIVVRAAMPKIKGKFSASREIYDGYEWHSIRTRSKRFQPKKEKSTSIPDAELAYAGALGVSVEHPVVQEQAGEYRKLESSLSGLVGAPVLLRAAKWRDPSQSPVRIFSPVVPEDRMSPLSLTAATRSPAEYPAGWDTTLRISGLADVYNIWDQDQYVKPTTIEAFLINSNRKNGSPLVRSTILMPIRSIEVVSDPKEIIAILKQSRSDDGREMLVELEELLADEGHSNSTISELWDVS